MVRRRAFEMGQERTEAMLTMQKELLGAYEEASRAWLARVKSEVELWTGLAKTDGDPFRSGRGGGLPGMCGAANENGRGRRTADGRGMPKVHDKDQPRAVQWVADRKYLKPRLDVAESGALHSCKERSDKR